MTPLPYVLDLFRDFGARVNPDEAGFTEAVDSVMTAALGTQQYLAAVRRDSAAKNGLVETRLIDAWRNAGLKLQRFDSALADACLVKAKYWTDPEGWPGKQLQDTVRTASDVYDEARRLLRSKPARATDRAPATWEKVLVTAVFTGVFLLVMWIPIRNEPFVRTYFFPPSVIPAEYQREERKVPKPPPPLEGRHAMKVVLEQVNTEMEQQLSDSLLKHISVDAAVEVNQPTTSIVSIFYMLGSAEQPEDGTWRETHRVIKIQVVTFSGEANGRTSFRARAVASRDDGDATARGYLLSKKAAGGIGHKELFARAGDQVLSVDVGSGDAVAFLGVYSDPMKKFLYEEASNRVFLRDWFIVEIDDLCYRGAIASTLAVGASGRRTEFLSRFKFRGFDGRPGLEELPVAHITKLAPTDAAHVSYAAKLAEEAFPNAKHEAYRRAFARFENLKSFDNTWATHRWTEADEDVVYVARHSWP